MGRFRETEKGKVANPRILKEDLTVFNKEGRLHHGGFVRMSLVALCSQLSTQLGKHNWRTIKARETHGKSLLYKISHLWSFCLLIVKVSVSTLLEICISSGYKSSNGNSKDCLL